jgi:protein phosphatase PTC2/3
MDKQSKPFGIGGYKGRIIFLGDGTEVLTDSDDAEMFDNAEEDKDLASQVSKSSAGEAEGSSTASEDTTTANSTDASESTSKDTPAEETKAESAEKEETKA